MPFRRRRQMTLPRSRPVDLDELPVTTGNRRRKRTHRLRLAPVQKPMTAQSIVCSDVENAEEESIERDVVIR